MLFIQHRTAQFIAPEPNKRTTSAAVALSITFISSSCLHHQSSRAMARLMRVFIKGVMAGLRNIRTGASVCDALSANLILQTRLVSCAHNVSHPAAALHNGQAARTVRRLRIKSACPIPGSTNYTDMASFRIDTLLQQPAVNPSSEVASPKITPEELYLRMLLLLKRRQESPSKKVRLEDSTSFDLRVEGELQTSSEEDEFISPRSSLNLSPSSALDALIKMANTTMNRLASSPEEPVSQSLHGK
ncbi:hypothetical protein Ciccas_000238 [Cichlidogyrus casuarinus]|uniref:Uncharacterized protein n=1 Tax=Cichlidogyrus casuarinus TaxID=1844966 RepID=A0ABD2QNI1_9PLAT